MGLVMDLAMISNNFVRIVRDHYFDLHGRVGRSEFWYFALAYMVLAILAGILGGITGLPLQIVYSLGMLLPAAGMGARRLQDVGRDGRLVWIPVVGGFAVQIYGAMAAVGFWLMGWFSWVLFGPLLGIAGTIVFVSWVVLLYFWIQRGNPGDNQYGPPPPVFDPVTRPAV
jgi:uncharacterized membrane protein YhaH (DUF805 family)